MNSEETIWKPSKRQASFISLPDSIFEALYGGAAGGGKTDALLMLPIARQWWKHPRFRGIILRRTYPELEAEVIQRTQQGISCEDNKVLKFGDGGLGARYNSEKKRWTFPEGGSLTFGHAEYESDVRKYDSAEYNYMAFDELTSFTEFQYLYLSLSRCRTSSNLPAVVRAGTNPGNIGHSWVKKRFILPAPYGTIIADKISTLKRIFIQSLVTDNPHMDPGYIHKLDALPEAERRAKRDGDWDTFEGQVFDDWRENILPGEPENALHVISPFEIPTWWKRFLAVDWGYAAMTCALWGALSPNDRLYIYREYTAKQTKNAVWMSELGRLCNNEEYSDVVLCRSAWQTRGDEQTIQEQFRKYTGLVPRQADNDRISGKLRLQEYLRWKPLASRPIRSNDAYDREYAAKLLRNNLDEYKSYLQEFQETAPEDNLPKLQVFPDCTELRNCIPLCIYDKKSNVTSKPPEDVKEFDGDDPYDCVRYLVMAAEHYVGTLKSQGDHRSEVNKIIEDLQKNQDQTMFYRRMEMVEAKERRNITVKPVRRASRVRVGMYG